MIMFRSNLLPLFLFSFPSSVDSLGLASHPPPNPSSSSSSITAPAPVAPPQVDVPPSITPRFSWPINACSNNAMSLSQLRNSLRSVRPPTQIHGGQTQSQPSPYFNQRHSLPSSAGATSIINEAAKAVTIRNEAAAAAVPHELDNTVLEGLSLTKNSHLPPKSLLLGGGATSLKRHSLPAHLNSRHSLPSSLLSGSRSLNLASRGTPSSATASASSSTTTIHTDAILFENPSTSKAHSVSISMIPSKHPGPTPRPPSLSSAGGAASSGQSSYVSEVTEPDGEQAKRSIVELQEQQDELQAQLLELQRKENAMDELKTEHGKLVDDVKLELLKIQNRIQNRHIKCMMNLLRKNTVLEEEDSEEEEEEDIEAQRLALIKEKLLAHRKKILES